MGCPAVSWPAEHLWLPIGIYWWYDCWQRQQDEFGNVLRNLMMGLYSAQGIRTEFTRCRWTTTWSRLQKQPNRSSRQRSRMVCNGQVSHLTWIGLNVHFKQNWRESVSRTSRKWRQLQWRPGRTSMKNEDEIQHLVMSLMRPRLQAVIYSQGFATKY